MIFDTYFFRVVYHCKFPGVYDEYVQEQYISGGKKPRKKVMGRYSFLAQLLSTKEQGHTIDFDMRGNLA